MSKEKRKWSRTYEFCTRWGVARQHLDVLADAGMIENAAGMPIWATDNAADAYKSMRKELDRRMADFYVLLARACRQGNKETEDFASVYYDTIVFVLRDRTRDCIVR